VVTRKPDQSLPLPPVDSCFRALDHAGAPQNIAALAIVNGTPDITLVSEKINSLLEEFPRLATVFYGNSWPREYQKKDFSPSEHCKHHAIQGDINALVKHASELLIKPFKAERPLWELHSISSSTEVHTSLLLFKLHHSLGDGMSGLYFFHRLLGAPRQKKRNYKKEKLRRLLSVLPFIFQEVVKKQPKLPIHGSLSKKRMILAYALPNDSIQILKQSFSCTSFSVVLSLISRALTQYFEHKQFSPHASGFRALIPVTMRGRSSIDDLGNEIGGASIDIPLGIEHMKDSVEAINRSLQSLMYENAYSAYHLCASIFSIFPLSLQTALCRFAANRLSGICTFLQAPASTLAIDNCEVLHEFAIPALLPNQGLSFGFIKQGRYMNISVILDPEVITDHTMLDSCMLDSLHSISSDCKTGITLADR
jgi:hypothetical protein